MADQMTDSFPQEIPEERGKVATPGRRLRDRMIPLAIGVLFILNGGIGAVVFKNTEDLQRADQDRGFRLCERQERVKANVHRGFPVGSRERRFVELRLPIVDCRPNLEGEAATPMSTVQMRGYVRRFVNGELRALPETPKRR